MFPKPKPKWWLVFALVPLTIAFLVVDESIPLPTQGHQLLEFGIILVTFGLMALWVRVSQGALITQGTRSSTGSLRFETTEGTPTEQNIPLPPRCGNYSQFNPQALDPRSNVGRYN